MNVKAPFCVHLGSLLIAVVWLFSFSADAQYYSYYHSNYQSYYQPYYRPYHPSYYPYRPYYRRRPIRHSYYRRRPVRHAYYRRPVRHEYDHHYTRSRYASRGRCGPNRVNGTVYNTPHANIRVSWAGYRSFRSAVRMEGSGILSNGRVLNYNGRIVRNTCPKYFGDATVVAGGRPGNCLIPFISVAADLRFYQRGDIIEVPQLKGKWVSVPPSGVKRQHPGYFIVQDSGGAIKGRGRFDFYTGSYSDRDPHNLFARGPAPLRMQKNSCDKAFSVITPHNPEYAAKLAAIDQFIYGTDKPKSIPLSNAVAAIH